MLCNGPCFLSLFFCLGLHTYFYFPLSCEVICQGLMGDGYCSVKVKTSVSTTQVFQCWSCINTSNEALCAVVAIIVWRTNSDQVKQDVAWRGVVAAIHEGRVGHCSVASLWTDGPVEVSADLNPNPSTRLSDRSAAESYQQSLQSLFV